MGSLAIVEFGLVAVVHLTSSCQFMTAFERNRSEFRAVSHRFAAEILKTTFGASSFLIC